MDSTSRKRALDRGFIGGETDILGGGQKALMENLKEGLPKRCNFHRTVTYTPTSPIETDYDDGNSSGSDNGFTKNKKSDPKDLLIDFDDLSGKTASYDPTYASNIFDSKFQREMDLVLNRPVCSTALLNRSQSFTELYRSMCCHTAEMCCENGLHTNTFILAVNLIDRALYALMSSKKIKFRLLSCTCLLLACKVEEIYHPTVDALIGMSGYCFNKEQLVHMEQSLLLDVFKFDISTPTRYEFACQFTSLAKLSENEKSMVSFIVELSMFDFNLNYFKQSQVAAGAVHLTLQMMRASHTRLWSPVLERATRCKEKELVEIVIRLRSLHWNCEDARMKWALEKYSTDEYQRVSEKQAILFSALRFDNLTLSKDESSYPLKTYCLE